MKFRAVVLVMLWGLSLEKVGMSGHSFGAGTTQAVSGQAFPGQGKRLTDKRIAAAVAFSPSSPRRGSASAAFGAVSIPWMLMTALPGDKEVRNRNHHRAILALSTAFWDAYIRGDKAAREWLDGAGPQSVLEKQDRWQRK